MTIAAADARLSRAICTVKQRDHERHEERNQSREDLDHVTTRP